MLTPWKNDLHINDDTDSNDITLNPTASTRTSSIASTSSSIRRQAIFDHPTAKRQRKTME